MADKLEKKFIETCSLNDFNYLEILNLYVESYINLPPPSERLLVAYAIKKVFEILHNAGINIQEIQKEIEENTR